MQAERIRVLELVKSGVLSIEQADELIDALQTANQPPINSNFSEQSKRSKLPQTSTITTVTTETVDDRGFPRPPKSPRAPRASGGGKLSFEQMIQLENHGINANFIRELADIGLNDLTFDEVIALGVHGIKQIGRASCRERV